MHQIIRKIAVAAGIELAITAISSAIFNINILDILH